MKTVIGLVPLAIGVAALGVATWFLLTRDWALGPWFLAALLFAHGWAHLLFVFPQPEPAAATAGEMPWPFDMSRSWLTEGLGLDARLVRVIGTALMAMVFAGLGLAALSTVGVLVPGGWWAGLVVASAVGSMILLTMFYSASFLLGYAIDLVLVWVVFASVWSPVVRAPIT